MALQKYLYYSMKAFFIAIATLFFSLIACADDAQMPTPTQDDQAAIDEQDYQRSSQAADALRDLSRSQLSAGNTAGARMAASRSNVAQTNAIIAQDQEQEAADQSTDQSKAASK